MRNFKTDKGYKIVVDYMDWYYTWNEIRDYFALEEEGVYIVYLGTRELREIKDLDIPTEGVNRLLRRCTPLETKGKDLPRWNESESEEEYRENEEYYLKNYKHYEDEYEIRPFYISYYGSGNYRVQFCEAQEAAGMILIKRRKIGQSAAEDIGKKVFEHYIEGDFFYTQIYTPHKAEFIEENLKKDYDAIYYDYEDGGIFHLDEQEAIESLPEYCGKIIQESESDKFEAWELIRKD